MSRLIKKHVASEEEKTATLIQRHSRVYYKRLGKYRYVVVFPHLPSIYPKKQGLLIDSENYGIYQGIIESEINGQLLPYEDIPEPIINLIKRELRHGKYL